MRLNVELVVDDVLATVEFCRRLGLDVPQDSTASR
jgi:hypothetical protein